MRLIVLSSPGKFESELKIVPRLFDFGLEVFHLRKPKFSYRKMNKYLSKFPAEHLNKVIIHTHHRLALKYKLKGIHFTEKQKKKKLISWLKLKFFKILKPQLVVTTSYHSISDLLRDEKNYHYVFLSPVFDSISKKNYKSSFNEAILKQSLTKTRQEVIALGGVKKENIYKAKEFGFSGIAVLGSIWGDGKDPVKELKELQNLCSGKNLEILPLNITAYQ